LVVRQEKGERANGTGSAGFEIRSAGPDDFGAMKFGAFWVCPTDEIRDMDMAKSEAWGLGFLVGNRTRISVGHS